MKVLLTKMKSIVNLIEKTIKNNEYLKKSKFIFFYFLRKFT
jgi:hypothetical protein